MTPEENAPEESAPEPSITVKDSTTATGAPPVEEIETTQNICTVYEQNIGALTPMIAERLKDIEEEYGAHWFTEAVMEAVANNVRNLRYIETILARWQRDGFKTDKRQQKGNNYGQRKSNGRNTAAHAQQNAGADPTAERELIERIKRRKERQHASV